MAVLGSIFSRQETRFTCFCLNSWADSNRWIKARVMRLNSAHDQRVAATDINPSVDPSRDDPCGSRSSGQRKSSCNPPLQGVHLRIYILAHAADAAITYSMYLRNCRSFHSA